MPDGVLWRSIQLALGRGGGRLAGVEPEGLPSLEEEVSDGQCIPEDGLYAAQEVTGERPTETASNRTSLSAAD